jgi:fibro-slime domain-containing protein
MKRAPLVSSGVLLNLTLVLSVAAGGCSTTNGGNSLAFIGNGNAAGGTASLSPGTNAASNTGTSLNVGEGGTTSTTTTPEKWPPEQCTGEVLAGDVGAYCLGPEVGAADKTGVSNDNANTAAGCGTTLWGVVRDFINFPGNLSTEQKALVTYASPDFGTYCCSVQERMVLPDLGADDKPVYSSVGATSNPQMMTSEADFNKWYNDVENFNIPYYVAFHFEDNGSGVFTFSAATDTVQYLPLDNMGWGNDENTDHNYRFTTEIHTQFRYQGGEVFSFSGDDDLWVFINKKLAIDIGGVHVAVTKSVNLDDQASALGLTVGNVYSMDLFGAERYGTGSNFHIETSMTFVDCGAAPPVMQ